MCGRRLLAFEPSTKALEVGMLCQGCVHVGADAGIHNCCMRGGVTCEVPVQAVEHVGDRVECAGERVDVLGRGDRCSCGLDLHVVHGCGVWIRR